MSICKECNGLGRTDNLGIGLEIECSACHGTGRIEQTDEERKQFINEYCRNVGNIKIKCDDCKFQENCVDYGWEGCKKFTPKPSEQFTNEEWFCSLSTEEKAKVLGQIANNAYQCGQDGKTNKCVNRNNCQGYCDYGWEKWLKEPHTNKE